MSAWIGLLRPGIKRGTTSRYSLAHPGSGAPFTGGYSCPIPECHGVDFL
jgi:hypothetical protein